MPKVPAPLPETDYQTMECPPDKFSEIYQGLPEETQYCIVNTTHRLFEVDWIKRKLEEEITRGKGPAIQEGLLSLQVYLLLTCADNLGHTYVAGGGVWRRFRQFFEYLPQEAKQNLTDNILTWETDFAELSGLGLGNIANNEIYWPSRQQIEQSVQSLSPDTRLGAIVEFLYMRRNDYTHESQYPQLGHHPNLSVMQGQRLNIPDTATQGERDRLQQLSKDGKIYFTYYETDDVIATIRWSIVRGLGKVIGSV